MSKAAKRAPAAAADPEALPFEKALGKLESIVEAMETEDLSLEDLLAQYEQGTRLVTACQQKLAQAEIKIQELEQTAAGGLEVKPAALDAAEE